MTLGREILKLHNDKIERLIKSPNERAAGYIDALRDVMRVMNGGEMPDFDYPPPTQEPKIG